MTDLSDQHLLEQFTATLSPRLLLGFFTDQKRAVHVYKMDCTPHPTRTGEFEIGATRPGTLDDIDTLRRLVNTVDDALLHEHVLKHTSTESVWWVPAGPQQMLFRSKTGNEALNALNGQTFPQPPLVMIRRGHMMYVYALKEDRRPTLDSELLTAPYLNMFQNGLMCTGTVKLPEHFNPADPHAHTRCFFGSDFNGANTPTWKGCTHTELWTDAQARGALNPDHLIPHATIRTLRDALRLKVP